MSARHERRRKARQAGALLAEAALDKPEVVGHLGPYELRARGRVIFALPEIRPEFPADLRAAWERRRAALLSGRCECEGTIQPGSEHGLQIHHARGCIASDDWIREITARHGGTTITIPPGMFGAM